MAGVFLFLAMLQGVQEDFPGDPGIISPEVIVTPPNYQPFRPPPMTDDKNEIKIDDPEEPVALPTLDPWFPQEGGILPPIAPDGPGEIRFTEEIFDPGNVDEQPYPISQTSPRVGKAFRGTVIVECVVEENGTVSRIQVLDPPSPFIANAITDALRQWRFEPGRNFGEPVKVRVRIPFRFE